MTEPTAHDYVVVGAGSAGCALANRLSESGEHSVLLLEAGAKSRYSIAHRLADGVGLDLFLDWAKVPLGTLKLWLNPDFVWDFHTLPEENMKGQSHYWPRGRALGGSSSINGMLFVRGDPAEYARWAESGCSGWDYDGVLPFLKKLEHRAGGDPRYRGLGGPITVSDITVRDELTEAFFGACVESGIPITEDYNAEHYEGVAYLQLSTVNGERCSTAVGYLEPVAGRPNLTIAPSTEVRQLLVEGNRVAGVVAASSSGERIEYRGERETILSAGSIKSPHLLELSGIGDPEVLRKAGIEPRTSLPGVGNNLSDHINVRLTYECRKPITLNDVLSSTLKSCKVGLDYILRREGILASSSVSVHALTRSRPEEPRPNLKLQLGHLSGNDRYAGAKRDSLDPFSGFNMGAFCLKPESRGWVHASSADPTQPPDIRANYFAAQADMDATVAAIEMLRDIADRPALKALITREVRPGPDTASREELVDYIKETGQTCWHPVGTCKMGSDEMAVVDDKLRVHGIESLRVADASVMPHLVSSNTNAPSIMIGERCADFILSGQ